MFPYTDPLMLLDLHNQHAADIRREIAGYRGRHVEPAARSRRFGRKPRPGRAPDV